MTRTTVRALLLLLVAWSIGVRLAGIDYGVPCLKEPDTFVPDHVRFIRKGEPHRIDRTLTVSQYPSLLADVVAPLSDGTGEPRGDERTLEEHLHSAARPWLDTRIVIVLLSSLLIPATYLIARRFVTPGWALFAAATSAFSLLCMCFAQQARPHGALMGLSALAIACALWLRRSPGWLSYGANALAAAAAIGTLHSGVFVLAPIAAAQWLRADRRRWDARILLVLAAAAASLRVFYWYYFDEQISRTLAERDGSHYQMLIVKADMPFDGSGFARIARTLWFYEPVLLALVALATVVWLLRLRAARSEAGTPERADLLVVLAYAVPYLLAFGLHSATYERFVLPLLAPLAVFAAWGLATLQARLGAPRAWFGALCLASLALPCAASNKLAWLRARPSTLDQTAAWLRENADLEHEALFVMPPLDFPLMRRADTLRGPRFSPWSEYQAKLADELKPAPVISMTWFSAKPEFGDLSGDEQLAGYVRSFGPGVFITEALPWQPQRVRVRDGLALHARLVARVSPDPDPRFSVHPLWAQDAEFDDWPHVFARVLRARAVGPVIEIYRVD